MAPDDDKKPVTVTFEERRAELLRAVGRPRRHHQQQAPTRPHYEPTPGAIYWSCKRKVRYRDDNAADHAAKRRGLRSYFCTHCLGFHLTSQKEIDATKILP